MVASNDARSTLQVVTGTILLVVVVVKDATVYGSDVDRIRQQIETIYEQHNPDKLQSLATILEKYAGQEGELLEAIRDKYGIAADDPRAPTVEAAQNITKAAQAGMPSAEARAEHDRYYATALSMQTKGDLRKSEVAFRAALKSHPHDSSTLTFLSIILYMQTGAYSEEQESLLRHALAAEPLHDRACLQLAALLESATKSMAESQSLKMRAQEMGKWGRNKREEAYRLALAGGGTRSSGERALYAFGKGCPPYICVQGIRGLAPTWWDGVQTAEAISFGRAGGSVVPPTESADGAVVRPAIGYRNALPSLMIERLAAGLGRVGKPGSFWADYTGSFSSYYMPLLRPPSAAPTTEAGRLANHPLPGNPSNLIESAIQQLHQLLPAEVRRRIVGAEYWGHVRHEASKSMAYHSLHFDEDHTLASREGKWQHPIATALIYLSEPGVGGPTIVLNQTRSGQFHADIGWVIVPAKGLVGIFQGDLLHGAMPSIRGASATGVATDPRMSINVAFWADTACLDAPTMCRNRNAPGELWEWEYALPPWEIWEAGFPGKVQKPRGRSKARMVNRKRIARREKAGLELGRPDLGGPHGTLEELVAAAGGTFEMAMPVVEPVWVD